MKLAFASDLHIEFDAALLRQTGDAPGRDWVKHLRERDGDRHPRLGPDLQQVIGADLLMLAGDVAAGMEAVEYAAEAAAYCGCPVILVPGNHEFYGLDMDQALADMRSLAAGTKERVHVLDRDRIDMELAGRRVAFLGATLWTDYALMGAHWKADAMHAAAKGLRDHSVIRREGGAFRPNNALALHIEARKWLAENIPTARHETDLVVVVTHHAPVREAVPPQYRGTPLSPAFASDMAADIEHWQPDLWICGHTHHCFETTIGHCRVIAAQRGYIGIEPAAYTFKPHIETV